MMGVKQILGYICLAGAAVSFFYMYLMPRFNRDIEEATKLITDPGKRNPAKTRREDQLIRIEERTGLMIPLQLILIGSVLLT